MVSVINFKDEERIEWLEHVMWKSEDSQSREIMNWKRMKQIPKEQPEKNGKLKVVKEYLDNTKIEGDLSF